MTKIAKTFTAKIQDEYGGVYPQAYVAILDFSESSQTTGSAKDHTAAYEIDQDIEAISYELMYWYDQQKVGKFKSRPLVHENDNGEFSTVFTVDLSKPQVANALNSTTDPIQNILTAIELDVKTKAW